MSGTPKSAGSRKSQSAQLGGHQSAAPSLLDAFPVWQDQVAADKEPAGRHEDPLGTLLPTASQPFCDAWKRAEELLHGAPNVPLVCLKPAPDVDKKGKGVVAVSRELDGKLYAGHETFDWLLAVISYIVSAEKYIKKGDYLWELITPKDKDGLPARSPTGKYRVKLFIVDTWRTVTIDDRIPVDLFGRALLVGSRPLQLWPLLLCKAILKVMAVYKSLDNTLPHQVAAFQMLTGWPQEDLGDPLGGTPIAGAALFDRLEDVLGGPLAPVQEVAALASCCLVKRSKPQRAPPRLVVLTGPSAVGRSQLIARLVAEFPDKFGVTVSHTSRPPMEHEVDGKSYYFTDKHKLLADVRSNRFLEAARVAVHCRPETSSAAAAAVAPKKPLSYWYGTSLATVREVAATGKLCVMSLDMQGAEALRANKRIDGLYLYVNTSSPDVLSSRQKQRLAEPDSTLSRRVAWAKQQVTKSQSPGLFDAIVPNTTIDQVYVKLKEAISTLSPIIRNRLRGLPSYVLDYSDLIPPNSVEKPFLKPVILAGPHVGERRKLLEMLAEEFSDVFAFPRQHTTRPPDEHLHHIGVDGDELQLLTEKSGTTPRSARRPAETSISDDESSTGAPNGSKAASQATAAAAGAGPGEGGDKNGQDHMGGSLVLGLAPVVMSKDEFEAAANAGKFLEVHADLLKHPLVAHRHGHAMEHVKEVIRSGKLPLMELEAEGAETVRVAKTVDCLTIFLAPPSIEIHEEHLKEAATESDFEIAERQAAAAADLKAMQSKPVFDQVVVNDVVEDGYKQLKAAISKFRPDLIPPAEDDEAAQAAKKAAAASQAVPLIVLGPAGGGREQLVQQLMQRYPNRFLAPRKLSDKKPGKGDKDVSADVEYVKPDVLTKMTAQGQLVWSQQDPASGCTMAITADALNELAAAGKMAVLDIGAASQEQLQVVRQHPAMKGAFAVHVCRKATLTSALASLTEAAANAQVEKAVAHMQEQIAAGLVQAAVDHDDPEEGFAQLQEPLSVASPWAMPPLLQPLVVAAPFGSGKRAVLQKLCKMLPHVFAVPKVVTSRPRSNGNSTAEDMDFVSSEVAQQMQAEGKFLICEEVLGHVYGISAASVRKLQASGKLPLLDLDKVADVTRLKSSGFQATYVYLQPPSLEQLQQRVSADILANPPLHHDPAEAAEAAAAAAVKEASTAAAQPELFDAMIKHDPQELLSTVGQLSELLHGRYPTAVPSSFVWGYGRPLWDVSSRAHGLKPLRVVLLGPAASGKSTQCAVLASRFGIPHINAGDLLYAEVAAKTPLGLDAKQYMDSSKTVPDTMLLTVLLKRLTAADCQAQGWVLDGFPHTRQQAQTLSDAGHVPDKVILFEGPHNMLLDRVKYRRIDYQTGKVYHIAETGAMSEAVRPLRPDGSPDTDIMSRLAVRHDDSLENVANRLTLWDRQVQGLRLTYEDVLMRLPAAGPLDDITSACETCIKLEATHSTGSCAPGSIWPIIPSWQLEELTYKVVATLKYQRRQLVQLQQLDGKLTWCDLKELSSNVSCMLLMHNPTDLPVVKSIKRLDINSLVKQQLLAVDSPEPFRVLVNLSMGPQHPALPPPAPTNKVIVLAGPCGAGRSTLARQLMRDFSDKLMQAPLLTTRVPHIHEVDKAADSQSRGSPAARAATTSNAADSIAGTASIPRNSIAGSINMQPNVYPGSDLLQFVPEQQFKLLDRSGQLVGVERHLQHSYGLAFSALEAIAAVEKFALVVAPLVVAEQLRKELLDTQVVCVYVTAGTASLDCRLRLPDMLDEQRLQDLLQDATEQDQLLQLLLDQQADDVRAEQVRQQTTTAAASVAAQIATVPSTPGSTRMAKEGVSKALQLQQLAALQQQQSQQNVASSSSVQPAFWLHSVINPAGQLQACYSDVKGALSKHWPAAQQRLPGLLLVQRCPARIPTDVTTNGTSSSSRPNTSSSSRPGTSNGNRPGTATGTQRQTAVEVAASSSAKLDDDVFSLSQTLLRLKSITASSSMLQLPRGKHLLQLQCSQQLLHCINLYAAAEFVLDDAAKLLPAMCGVHVTVQEGRHDMLQADSRQLLFRYLLRPNDSCTVSIEFRPSSAALQACTQLMLIDNSSREVTTHALNQLLNLQLAATEKGHTLLALAQPHAEVPAGSWSTSIMSSSPLQPLQELLVQRQVAFDGTYIANTAAVLGRFVVNTTIPAQLAVLSQLRMPAGAAAGDSQLQPPAVSSISSPAKISSTSSRGARLPLAYSLQVFDTGGAKEVIWGSSYKLVAETTATAGSNGRALLPSLLLQPGKYLLVLQLQTDACQQWVDVLSGVTDPAPNWQLLLLPSADEKACSIVRDDAYERHFKSTVDSWQQQAAQLAQQAAQLAQQAAAGPTGTTVIRPGSREASSTPAAARMALAAVKDRPKAAQQALERHLAAEQQAASVSSGLTTLSIPGGALSGHAITGGHAANRKASHPGGKPKTPPQGADRGSVNGNAAGLDGSISGSLQVTPRVHSGAGSLPLAPMNKLGVPAVAVRQVKGGDLQIAPSRQLKHIDAGKQQPDSVQQVVNSDFGSVGLAALQPGVAAGGDQSVISALQSEEAANFADWRSSCMSEQQAAAGKRRHLITALAGPAPEVPTPAPAAVLPASRKADRASTKTQG